MRRQFSPLGSAALFGMLDVLLLHAGFFATIQALAIQSVIPTNRVPLAGMGVLGIVTIVALGLFYLFELYGDWFTRPTTDIVLAVTFVVTATDLCLFALYYLSREMREVWLWAPVIVAAQVLLIAGTRCAIRRVVTASSMRRTLLVVAADEESGRRLKKAAEEDRSQLFGQYELVMARELEAYDYRIRSADTVLLGPGVKRREDLIRCCAMFGKDTCIVPDGIDLLALRGKQSQMGDILTVAVHCREIRGAQELAKRLFDMVFSSVAIIICAPVMAAIAIAVRRTSRGPAIFRQERVGKDGVPYVIYKFRTMVEGAETKTGPVLARKQDPRITRLGKFLRSTRMDELPQFFNVLRGEMSMVGPRPEREFFACQFENENPMWTLRSIVKPGITGLAQVQGRYATTAQDKLRFDLYYISNHSFLMDLRIICRTMVVVLLRRQAEGVATGASAKRVESARPVAHIAELEHEEPMMSD